MSEGLQGGGPLLYWVAPKHPDRTREAVRDFEHSTLWDLSEYERVSAEGGASAFTRLGRNSTLSTSMIGELRRVLDRPG